MADQEKPKSVFLQLLKEQAVKDGKLSPEDVSKETTKAPQPQASSQPDTDKTNRDVKAELKKIVDMFGGDPSNLSIESFAFNAAFEGALEQAGKDFDALLPKMLANEQLIQTLKTNLPPLAFEQVEHYKKPTKEEKAAFREELAALAVLNKLPSQKEAYLAKLKASYDKTDDLSLLVGMKLGQTACLVFTKAGTDEKDALRVAALLLNEKIESVIATSTPQSKEKPNLDPLVNKFVEIGHAQAIQKIAPAFEKQLPEIVTYEHIVAGFKDGWGEKAVEALANVGKDTKKYAQVMAAEFAYWQFFAPADKAQEEQKLEERNNYYQESDLETTVAINLAMVSILGSLQDKGDSVKKSQVDKGKDLVEKRLNLLCMDEAKDRKEFGNIMSALLDKMAKENRGPDEPVNLSEWEWKDKAPYEIHDAFVDNAKVMLSSFDQIANQIFQAVEHKLREGGDDIEDYFKHIYYRMLIDFHLKLATFIQPGLMSTLLRLADDNGKSYLKPLIHFGHHKRMLATMFQELIVPVGRGAEAEKQVHQFSSKLVPSPSVIFDSQALEQAVSTNGKIDKAEVVDVFMEWSVFIQSALATQLAQSRYLEGFLNESPKATTNLDEANDTWVVYCLNHALDSWKKFGKRGLDHYPNQGPNVALLFCFLGHVINMDMNIDESTGVPIASSFTPRYNLADIPKLSGKENLMTTQTGSHIFEKMI